MPDHFVHERAWCESSSVGAETRVWAFTHVMKGAVIGSGCNIGEQCFIENDVMIGNDVTIKNGISVWNGVRLEDRVFLGPNMVFTNDARPRSKAHDYHQLRTIVGKGASIGANATIIGGVKVGKYAMIGAGSVVTKDVPDHALVYGNPAIQHGWVCVCGEKLDRVSEPECICGKKFRISEDNCKITN